MNTHPSRWILAGTLLAAAPVRAEPDAPVAQGVSIGVSNLRHFALIRRSEQVTTLEAAYQRAAGTAGFGRHLYLGGGLRFAVPTTNATFPLEGFARAELRARMGFWEPGAGLELGLSQVALPFRRIRLPTATEMFAQEEALNGPVYFAIHVAPLRFHVGRFVLGGPEVQWGPAGPPFGTEQRLQIGLARLEMQL